MSVEQMERGPLQEHGRWWYYACPKCGWCGPLRRTRARAAQDGRAHRAAKAAA